LGELVAFIPNAGNPTTRYMQEGFSLNSFHSFFGERMKALQGLQANYPSEVLQ
jgi:hypothetical protein